MRVLADNEVMYSHKFDSVPLCLHDGSEMAALEGKQTPTMFYGLKNGSFGAVDLQ